MPTRQNVFPLDLTMKLASNRITNEVKQFESPADRIFVPNAGPFYTESMVITTSSGRPLQPITEFKLLYMNEEATLASGRNVCAVIHILNESIESVVLEYRVIGGEYGNTVHGILQELKNTTALRRNVDWKTNVYNKPSEYPPAPHFHRGEDFTDWDTIWYELDGIRKAIIVGDEASWASVYRYMNRRISAVEGNVSSLLLANVNTLLDGYVLKSSLGNYHTKTEITKLLDAQKVRLSTDSGNLLELRGNGLYYGIQAPADLSNLYVDAVGGNDDYPGTKEQPLKTLDKALSLIPSNISNTIHLKVIPEQNKNTHSYFISKIYEVKDGATRTIQPYGHSLIDGEDNAAARKLDPNNYWTYSALVPEVPIWIHWHELRRSTNAIDQEPAKFFVRSNGTFQAKKCEFILARPVNTANRKLGGYSYRSIFGGGGKLTFHACSFIRLTSTGENSDNTALANRPAFNETDTNSAWWFMSYDSTLNIQLSGANFYYATVPARSSANQHGHTQYGSVVRHRVYDNSAFSQVQASGFKGVPFAEIYTSTMSIYIEEPQEWGGSLKLKQLTNKQPPYNARMWFSQYNNINRINYLNGVPTNLTVNFKLPTLQGADNPNAYKVVNVNAVDVPVENMTLFEILKWNDGLSTVEYDRFMSGLSYHRITTVKLKTLNLDIGDSPVFADINPVGLQVTLYNATKNEVMVNQTLNGKNYPRVWLPYSAITLIFVSKTMVDVIGGIAEE